MLLIKRIILITYLLIIAIVAVFPFSAADVGAMNRVYILSFRLDHLIHVVAFLPLYPLLYWLIRPQSRQQILILLIISLIIASAAEYVQYFIDYRSYNPADLISNLTGAIIGFLAVFTVKKFKRIT